MLGVLFLAPHLSEKQNNMSAIISAKFVDCMGSDLTPVNAARISFRAASVDMTEKDQKLIQYLADHEHLTPFEHQTLTMLIDCPLYIRSQIHRHRTFAYNEVSRRYTSDNLEFYLPPLEDIRAQSKSSKQGSEGPIGENNAHIAHAWMYSSCNTALNIFNDLINMGVSREQARGILPQNLMTQFYMTGNLRNWCHFLKLRLDPHAQKEVQMVAHDVEKIIESLWPVSYKALMKPSAK